MKALLLKKAVLVAEEGSTVEITVEQFRLLERAGVARALEEEPTPKRPKKK